MRSVANLTVSSLTVASLIVACWTVSTLAAAAVLLAAPRAGSAAPEAPAKGLRLSAQARVTPEGGLALKAVFRSADASTVTFFVPEFFEAGYFPAWRFVRSDGATFRPYPAPFQSMWTEGDQGSLVPVAGERTWEVSHEVSLCVAVGAGSDDDAELSPLPLEPGRYRVHCAYEKTDATIPVGGPDFSVTRRTVKDLWTGRVEAAPLEVEIPRRAVVSLRIDGPRDVPAKGAYVLTVVLRNDTATEQKLAEALTLTASSKPNGNLSAAVFLGEPSRALAAGEAWSLTLAPGAERRFSVDLAGLVFRTHRDKPMEGRLAALAGQGIFHLSAAFGPPDAPTRLESNGLWRYVAPEAATR